MVGAVALVRGCPRGCACDSHLDCASPTITHDILGVVNVVGGHLLGECTTALPSGTLSPCGDDAQSCGLRRAISAVRMVANEHQAA